MARVKKEVLPPEHCSSVKEYESSPYWRKKSHDLLEDKSTVCEICGRPRWVWMPRKKKWKCRRFAVHHKHYRTVGKESPEDLLILDYCCHTMSHDILRYQNIHEMYKRLAEVVKAYFIYEGGDGFTPW